MSVNGVTSNQATTACSYSAAGNIKAENNTTENTKSESSSANAGAVYEPSSETASTGKATYKPDTNLINKMKADADARTAQLRSLVEKMMTGQANAYGKANGRSPGGTDAGYRYSASPEQSLYSPGIFRPGENDYHACHGHPPFRLQTHEAKTGSGTGRSPTV